MEFNINIKGKKRKIKIKEDTDFVKIDIEGKEFSFKKNNDRDKKGDISVAQTDIPKKKFSKKEIKAPIGGTVTKIFVKKGEKFKKDQKIVSLSAMKMENEIVAEFKGKIKKIFVKKDQKVQEGDVLVTLE